MTSIRRLTLLALPAAVPSRRHPPTGDYSMTCDDVQCYGGDERFQQSGDDITIDCDWRCATYEGEEKKTVRIEFTSEDGECFEITDLSVQDSSACWLVD